MIEVTRRGFLAGIGALAGGLTLGIDLRDARAAAAAAEFRPGAFIHIDAAGVVHLVCSRSEMGQGIRSSLPVLLADELGADWARVRVIQGDGDTRYGNQNTDGSRSVRDFEQTMRLAGATARAMLITAAARRWKVPTKGLLARDHAIVDDARGRSLGFGELVAAAALPAPKIELGPPPADARAGGPLPLIDAAAYVTGAARYGADVILPGMLTAVIARPPVVGDQVAHVDDTSTRLVPGVRHVVTLPAWSAPAAFQPLGGVAVVADHTWAAMQGRAALAVTWKPGDQPRVSSTSYRAALEASARSAGTVARQVGDADAALAGAAEVITAEYYVPLLAHTPMEPPAAVARYQRGADGDRCEVWAATQNPQSAQAEVARALELPLEAVTVHVTFLGGGFGRKSKPDYVAEAALLSREVGAPVRIQWSRTDDVRHGYYHAASAQRLEAGLGADGALVAWRHRVASPPIGSTFVVGADRLSTGELGQGLLDLPLAIPAVRVEACPAEVPARIGWMRSVYNINHAFAVQSFIAELAHARGRDPKAMLLDVLGPAREVSLAELGIAALPNYGASLDVHPVDAGRLRRVIERVTVAAGWDGRGARALGLAAHRSFLTYVAVVAEVIADPRGKPVVDQVWIACDAGRVINPDRVKSQLEGAVTFAMSLALHGEITVDDGAITQTNFRDYPLARIAETPRAVHVDVIASDHAPGGVGEPGVPPVTPAIANAIFALTGERLRALPLRGAWSPPARSGAPV
ncbi:MAG: molybdopterin cofactor-binding domain-containing protein [Kofleriaceae bacterium]